MISAMYQEKTAQVSEVVQNYFEGIYHGNVEQLRGSFAETAYIYGDVKGQEYAKSIEDYLAGVAGRKSPKELGENFEMEITGISFIGNNAMVNAHLPMLGYNYYDYLLLSVVNDEWKIVGKIFSHVE